MSFPVGAGVSLHELTTDPHPVLARLRAAEPVSWLPVLGGWLVTRHDLALAVMRDAATFTVDDPRFSTARVVGPSMLSLDGDAHARHREPFLPPFRPGPVRERFTPFLAATSADLIDGLVSAPPREAELRSAFAGPLAVAVVADALGLAGVSAATVLSWYEAISGSVSVVTEGGRPTAEGRAAVAALGATVARTLDSGDQHSVLRAAAGRLSVAEVVSNAAVLMFGGIDTTAGMVTNLVRHLLLHGTEPGLLPGAVEESLRLEPAAAVVDRYATRDLTLGGAAVRAGDLVVVSIAGANRDPAVFADPDRFDPERRDVRRHLAFVQGPHFCPGARLARAEATIAVRMLFERLPGLRPAADDPPRGLVFRRPPRLRVRWD